MSHDIATFFLLACAALVAVTAVLTNNNAMLLLGVSLGILVVVRVVA